MFSVACTPVQRVSHARQARTKFGLSWTVPPTCLTRTQTTPCSTSTKSAPHPSHRALFMASVSASTRVVNSWSLSALSGIERLRGRAFGDGISRVSYSPWLLDWNPHESRTRGEDIALSSIPSILVSSGMRQWSRSRTQDSISTGRESLDALLGHVTKLFRTAANGSNKLRTSGLGSQS